MAAQVASKAGYVDAYRSMREGALYLIIAFLLVSVGTIAVLFSLLPAFFIRPPSIWQYGLEAALVSLAFVAILVIIGGIIGLIGLWGKFVPGVRRLAGLNPEFGTSSTLIYVGLFWGLILMIIGAVLLLVIVGIFVMIVAAILMILGYVGLIVLGFKLYDVERSGLYLAAGILFIVGIFVPIASFIAWILLYVALGESIKRAEAVPAAPTAPAPVSPS